MIGRHNHMTWVATSKDIGELRDISSDVFTNQDLEHTTRQPRKPLPEVHKKRYQG
jgi:hypothetical protein